MLLNEIPTDIINFLLKQLKKNYFTSVIRLEYIIQIPEVIDCTLSKPVTYLE